MADSNDGEKLDHHLVWNQAKVWRESGLTGGGISYSYEVRSGWFRFEVRSQGDGGGDHNEAYSITHEELRNLLALREMAINMGLELVLRVPKVSSEDPGTQVPTTEKTQLELLTLHAPLGTMVSGQQMHRLLNTKVEDLPEGWEFDHFWHRVVGKDAYVRIEAPNETPTT